MTNSPPRDLVFLDTETLGLHPDAPIWEFAAVRRNVLTGAEQQTALTIQHDAGDWLDTLGDKFLDDYGARYDHAGAWCERAAAQHIQTFTDGAIVIACNPGFDLERLTRLLERNHIQPTWHYHPIDSASAVIGYLYARGTLPYNNQWKSDNLSALIGVNPADYDRHTAMGDVQWVIAQFAAMGRQEAPA